MTDAFAKLTPRIQQNIDEYNSYLLVAKEQKDDGTFFTEFANERIDSFILQMQRGTESEKALRSTISFAQKEIKRAPASFHEAFLARARRYIRIAVVDRMYECAPEEMQLCNDYIIGSGLGNGYAAGIDLEKTNQYNGDGLLFLFHADKRVWQYPASMCLELLFYLENAFVGLDEDIPRDKIIFVLPDAPDDAPAEYVEKVITATTLRMRDVMPDADFQFAQEHEILSVDPAPPENSNTESNEPEGTSLPKLF